MVCFRPALAISRVSGGWNSVLWLEPDGSTKSHSGRDQPTLSHTLRERETTYVVHSNYQDPEDTLSGALGFCADQVQAGRRNEALGCVLLLPFCKVLPSIATEFPHAYHALSAGDPLACLCEHMLSHALSSCSFHTQNDHCQLCVVPACVSSDTQSLRMTCRGRLALCR